jgi:hypothetical protein
MPRRFRDEVEESAMARPEDELPLFTRLELGDHPVRPAPQRAEQRALALKGGTLEGDYQAWRQSEEGAAVFAEIRRRALLVMGPRVAVKRLVEDVRGDLRVKVNNSHSALIARDLRDSEPSLRHRIELRERSAA